MFFYLLCKLDHLELSEEDVRTFFTHLPLCVYMVGDHKQSYTYIHGTSAAYVA